MTIIDTNFLQNTCCTQKQAIRFKELRILQLAQFYYSDFNNEPSSIELRFCRRHHRMIFHDDTCTASVGHYFEQGIVKFYNDFAAFSVAELSSMLLKQVNDCYFHNPSGMWSHSAAMWEKNNHQDLFSTQAECYADRVIYLMSVHKSKYNAEFINSRLLKLHTLKRIE